MSAILFVPAFKRVNYTTGQILAAADFEAEQSYFRNRLRRHVRLLHSTGVVHGLKMKVEDRQRLSISPGLAVDRAGNELVLENAVCLALPRDGRDQLVGLRYCERPMDPVPIVSESKTQAFARIEEGVEVLLTAAPEDRRGSRNEDVSAPELVILGRLRRTANGWKLERRSTPKAR